MIRITLLAIFQLALAIATAIWTSGCANSSTDRDFRRKVDTVEVGGGVEKEGDVTRGTGTVKVKLRDPDAK